RRSFLQQYGTVLSIMAVAGIWTAIVVTDRTLWERPESQPDKTITQADPDATVPPVPGQQPPAPQPDNAADPVAMPGNGDNSGELAATATPAPATPSPVAPAPVDPTEPIAPPVTPDAPSPDPSVASMALPVGETPAPNMAVVPVVPVVPETLPEQRMNYLSGDEFIIQPHAVDPGWYVSTRELPVEIGDTLVSPVPFRNSYRVGETLTIGLQPGTRVQRLMRRNNSDVALLLEQGQITLTRFNDSQNPVTVRLRVFGQDWFIKLLEPGTRVGVELVPTVPSGPPTDRLSVVIDGGIVVVEGKASVSTAGATVVELGPADGFVHWPAGGSTLVLRMDFSLPAWATVEGPFVTAATKQFGKLFQKEFNLEQTVEESLSPIAKDRRAGLSELAIKTLALIGDWKELVPALKNDHQESRLAAIAGLRHWLALNPGREPELREALSQNFAEDKVNTVVRLLWGFNEEDARSPTESAMLVGGLKDDDIAIRELAFQYISKLTARTFDYLPMAPLVERRAAINRWEEYVKRNNGALISD
ncbi:MAG TPA: hypothetical protein VNQ76_06765, partial [Planctomicrobium sp.]|nr:hypothetical protein [Planctomicrobium sp.]